LKLLRRTFLQFAGAAAAAPTLSGAARAQIYPSRPITMIVPAPAGGPLDVIARVLSEPMRGSLGQPLIIENVSGADGSIGTGRAARARPDGYTIDLGFLGGNVLNGVFYSLSYDVLNDFAPISPLVTTPLVLFARKTMPAKDLKELIAWLKANSNNRASVGIASVERRLVAAFLQKETRTQFALVPYCGTAPAVQDLVAGQIDLLIDTPIQLPLVRTGSIRAYAVTGDTRLRWRPTSRPLPRWNCRQFPIPSGSGFSHPGARRWRPSASSMWRQLRRSPIRRPDLGSLSSGSRFFRGISKRRKRSARL
jgi:tripartite-type tricarboxylate transporter receptor subunit TctC